MPWDRAPTPGPRVRLLEVDPDLGRWLRPAEVVEARVACVAHTEDLGDGRNGRKAQRHPSRERRAPGVGSRRPAI